MNFVFVLLAGVILMSSYSTGEPSQAQRDVDPFTHPTVRCENIHPVNGESDNRNFDRACASHCRTLGDEYEGGTCTGEFCHCRMESSPNPDSYPIVKCTDLIPDEGTSSGENHEACHSHCESLRNGYQKGHCERGICHCHVRI